MRKPRDYDAELRALADKAKQLKSRKQSQLGELVIATGADELSAEELAGALLAAFGTTDAATREAWRKRGAAFFRGAARGSRNSTGGEQGRTAQEQSAAPSADGTAGAA